MAERSLFRRTTAAMLARLDTDNAATAMKSVRGRRLRVRLEGDAPLQRPSSQTIIYEMHVRGFTRHPSSGVSEQTRGTYSRVIEKNSISPATSASPPSNCCRCSSSTPRTPRPDGSNYWDMRRSRSLRRTRGTAPRQDPLAPVNEFRDMVKALHRAGIEVILDVVFNHTAEGDHAGRR